MLCEEDTPFYYVLLNETTDLELLLTLFIQ